MNILIALILICISIYIAWKTLVSNTHKRKGVHAVKDVFKGVIKRQMLSISKVNRFGNRLIAIDQDRAKLVLIIYKDDIIWEKCLALNEIMFCQVIQTPSKSSNAIEKVSLQLTFRNNHDTISFPFFDEKLDDKRALSYCLRKVRFWKRIIQFQLSLRQIHGSPRSERNPAMI